MKRKRGFALVLVIALLGLLVLLCYALAALGKVDSQLAGTAVYQAQARQNALLGLNLALGELQRHAGPDDRVTGMAGITGVAAGGNHPARQWCGVWDGGGSFRRWLGSGGEEGTIPVLGGTDSVLLAGTSTLGGDATDREHVRALLRPVSALDSGGSTVRQGDYAYWVGDDGVKLSLVIPEADAVVAGQKHAIDEQFKNVPPDAASLGKVLAYEQLNFAGATTTQRQGGFHSHARTHYGLAGPGAKAGVLNVNSSSARYWAGVGATYNRWHPAGITNLAGFASRMAASTTWSAAAGDKVANGPFLSAGGFFSNAAVITAVTANGANLLEFVQEMNPWVSVRSDTFVIRAYGDAVNPAEATRVESRAYCEAIVQRTPEVIDSPGGPFGRRFVITGFRWLGPDDI